MAVIHSMYHLGLESSSLVVLCFSFQVKWCEAVYYSLYMLSGGCFLLTWLGVFSLLLCVFPHLGYDTGQVAIVIGHSSQRGCFFIYKEVPDWPLERRAVTVAIKIVPVSELRHCSPCSLQEKVKWLKMRPQKRAHSLSLSVNSLFNLFSSFKVMGPAI